MRFYSALQYLFQSYKIRRESWHPSQFIYLYVPSATEMNIKHSNGSIWNVANVDILANDWAVLGITAGPKIESPIA